MKDASKMRSADKSMIKNDRGLNVHDSDIKRMFGLDPKQKWPERGMAAIKIQGFTVWVRSLDAARCTEPNKRRSHRVRVLCPICDKDLSLGRLHQHQH